MKTTVRIQTTCSERLRVWLQGGEPTDGLALKANPVSQLAMWSSNLSDAHDFTFKSSNTRHFNYILFFYDKFTLIGGNQETTTKAEQERSDLLWLQAASHVIESKLKPGVISLVFPSAELSNTFPPHQITSKSLSS